MWLIIISLVAGCVIGASGMVPERCFMHLNKMIAVMLFLMLAALGAQIGNNAELLAKLPTLGWQAFLITVCSVAGSVAALWLLMHCGGASPTNRGRF